MLPHFCCQLRRLYTTAACTHLVRVVATSRRQAFRMGRVSCCTLRRFFAAAAVRRVVGFWFVAIAAVRRARVFAATAVRRVVGFWLASRGFRIPCWTISRVVMLYSHLEASNCHIGKYTNKLAFITRHHEILHFTIDCCLGLIAGVICVSPFNAPCNPSCVLRPILRPSGTPASSNLAAQI